jgi:glycosyltransferase involved in cell wall biosynthesis
MEPIYRLPVPVSTQSGAGYRQRPMPPQEQLRLGDATVRVGAGAPHASISVCHVITGQVWAGAQVQVATLLKSLSSASGLRLHSIVFEEGRLAEELRAGGVRVKVIRKRHAGSLLHIISQSVEFLAGQQIQIIHAHGYKENIVASVLAKLCRIPVQVRTFHGARTPFIGFKSKHRAALFLDSLLTRRFVDHNIIVSGNLAADLRPELDPAKISVIQNGVDVDRIASKLSVAEAKRRLQIPGNALVIGAVARLEEVKRLDLFHAAATHIASELPETRFVIAGTGSQVGYLKDLFRKSGLEDRVHFLGHRDDAYDVLRALDLLLITSDQEVPVISRAVGGIPEAIEDGQSGILVPTGDPRALAQACLLALRNPDLRRRLALAAASVVSSRFSAHSNAEQIVRVYRDLAGRDRARS